MAQSEGGLILKYSVLLAATATLAISACTPAETPAAPTPPAEEPADVETVTAPEAGVTALQLIKLDCGTIEVLDLDVFSSAGDYAGQTDTLTDTCWLVRHPDGDLLWDLGLPSMLAGMDEPQTDGVFSVSLATTIADQMDEMGLSMGDLDYVSISHSHFDHSGQADLLEDPLWLVNQAEYDFMFPKDVEAGEAVEGDAGSQFSAFEDLRYQIIGDEYDVFGDGSAVIFMTPGHTPGHASLQLMLPETGPVLLTGDLWHRSESRELRRVPRFNTDEAQTLASMDLFDARAKELGAKVIIQHEPDDTQTPTHTYRSYNARISMHFSVFRCELSTLANEAAQSSLLPYCFHIASMENAVAEARKKAKRVLADISRGHDQFEEQN